MVKQRKDSITSSKPAARHDLADKEKAEMAVLSAYMPQALTDAEIVDEMRAVAASAPPDRRTWAR